MTCISDTAAEQWHDFFFPWRRIILRAFHALCSEGKTRWQHKMLSTKDVVILFTPALRREVAKSVLPDKEILRETSRSRRAQTSTQSSTKTCFKGLVTAPSFLPEPQSGIYPSQRSSQHLYGKMRGNGYGDTERFSKNHSARQWQIRNTVFLLLIATFHFIQHKNTEFPWKKTSWKCHVEKQSIIFTRDSIVPKMHRATVIAPGPGTLRFGPSGSHPGLCGAPRRAPEKWQEPDGTFHLTSVRTV